MDKISNSILTVEISEHGAELQSIKKNGKEYLWQGDAKFWGRRSPVLFPNVGRVWEDKYRHAGNTYEIGQHGFARLMEHDFVDQTADTIVLELCANEETLKKFPFEFRLVSTFTLEGDTVHHTLTVENLDTDTKNCRRRSKR